MKKTAFVLALALLASVGRAADDAEFERAKAEFASIARQDEVGRARRGEPSLTALVQTFLAHDPALAMRAEAFWWNAAKRDDLWASWARGKIETAIQFLHCGDSPCPPTWQFENDRPIELVGGAVVVGDGPYFGLVCPPATCSYEELIGGRPFRKLAAPSATALFEAAEDPDRRLVLLIPRTDLGMALGEACSIDDDAYDELVRRSDGPKPAYLLALGWTGRPTSARMLTERLRALLDAERRRRAESADPVDHEADDAIDAAAVALHRADADEFARFVASVDVARGDDLVAALGPAPLVDRLLGRFAAAADVRRGRKELCGAAWRSESSLRGPGVERLLRVLLDARGDPASATDALAAVDRVCQAKRSARFGSSGTGRPSEEGRQIGWPGTVEDFLRRIVEDLDAGRLTAADGWPAFDAPRTPEDHGETKDHRLLGAPVRVVGEWTESTLRLTFRNDGASALSISATELRYPSADLVTVTGDPRTPGADRRLRLDFGRVGFRASTPAATLVPLAPGASWSCDVPVPKDLRSVDHVEVSVVASIAVVGTARAPIACFTTKFVEFRP